MVGVLATNLRELHKLIMVLIIHKIPKSRVHFLLKNLATYSSSKITPNFLFLFLSNLDLSLLFMPPMDLENISKYHKTQKPKTPKLLIVALSSVLIFFILTPLNYPYKSTPQNSLQQISTNYSEKNYCDLFRGEWVEGSERPYYTNMTCQKIQDHQNCMKHGKPGDGYLRWRWRPSEPGCDLPVFDPTRFISIMKGKSLAFVGDSLARNHMQSLLCMLSEIEDPIDVYEATNEKSQFKRYEYINHNFTIEMFWSPFLVKTALSNPNDTSQPFNLYLDEFDENWTTKIENFDYVIMSVGQWFFRPIMFYINNQLISCLWCGPEYITHVGVDFGFQMAYKTAFKAINSLENFKGVTFVRTFATSHFENGLWNETGDCIRTRPYEKNEVRLEGHSLDFYKVQIKEFEDAKKIGNKNGVKFRLFDVTHAMLMRPDGHPGKYYGKTDPKWRNDCVHWCLPGPIDSWNEFLLELLKREEENKL